MTCRSCEVLAINGLLCHETGCPDSHINPGTGIPYPVECDECGTTFDPEHGPDPERFCSESCCAAYYGMATYEMDDTY